ncbi:MAG TPA: hypothetical protein VNK89_09550 [Thermoflexus sp.]|nr:hypothetical protein [Thermoflexus sp.]
MARPQGKRHKRAGQRERNEESFFASFVGGAVGFLGAYLFAEAALRSSIHPIHWAVAAGGAALGYLMGLAWYRIRKGVL